MSEPEGFEWPVHRSLVQPMMVAGLPRTLAFLLWTFTLALVLPGGQVWVLLVSVPLHLLFALFARRDPYFFDVFLRAVKSKRRLEP